MKMSFDTAIRLATRITGGIYQLLLLACASMVMSTNISEIPTKSQHAQKGDVRLLNGRTLYEGRVEIYYHHQWGTVCDDSWSIEDAQVVCEQLGFGIAYAAKEGAKYGQGTGNITLDEVLCNGLENRLDECLHGGWFVHNCDHSEDAGVSCEKPSEPIINLDISPGIIVGGVLHSIVCLILIFACMRYCCVRRKSSNRKRSDSASHILQSAYSVDAQIGSTDHPPSYEHCRLFSPHTSGSLTTNSIFSSSTNNATTFLLPSILSRRQSQSEHLDEFAISMVIEQTNRTQPQYEQHSVSPPAYDSVMESLVIRVT